MALIQTVDSSDLYHLACRMDRGHNFGYNGWRAIGDYLESLSDSLGENIEIDIIAICCEYSMAESADRFYEEYDMGIDEYYWEGMDDEEKLEAIENYLQENTAMVICEDDLIIWQAF